MISPKYQSEISVSYLYAVASIAEVSFQIMNDDGDSEDVDLKKEVETPYGKYRSRLSVQLKSTYSRNEYHEDDEYIYYDLKVKNYNDLRVERSNPIILALLILPEDGTIWVENDVEKLLIRKCMYWVNLKHEPHTGNIKTVTIKIPKQNILTPESLIKILQEVSEGKLL